MNDTINTTIQFFDLENETKDIQEIFLDEIGEVIMESVLLKAWAELDASKRKTLTELLEVSSESPQDEEKRVAVLKYLDENVVNLQGFVKKELEDIQLLYKQTRDEIRDSE
jgi:hypothetical protein